MERTVRVRTDDAAHPMTLAEVEQFAAEARQAGAPDGAPIRFETTLRGRSRALSTTVTKRVTPTGTGNVNLEVKTR